MSIDIRDNYDIESFYQGFEEPENAPFNFDLKILAEIEKNQAEEVVFPLEKSNLHPLFESICNIIRPSGGIELSKKLVKIEAARAEAKMNKLKKINIEVKTLKHLHK